MIINYNQLNIDNIDQDLILKPQGQGEEKIVSNYFDSLYVQYSLFLYICIYINTFTQ